jgi:hypothetical protein
MPILEGVAQLRVAEKKRDEQRLWDLWLCQYPWMTEENFVAFDEFCKPAQIVTKKSTRAILDKVSGIKQRFDERGKSP